MSKKIWRPLNTYGLLAIACIVTSVILFAILALASPEAQGAGQLTINHPDGTTEVITMGNVVIDVDSVATTTATTTTTPTTPVVSDTDGDGVNDDVDQCPGTPAGVSVDATGCESVVVVNNGDYCAGSPAGVTCSTGNTFDSVWEYSGDIAQVINGDIISLPFTTRNSGRDGGQFSVTSQEPSFIHGESFWMWVSDTPGGTALQGAECSQFFARARGGMYWTQNTKYIGSDRLCYLGNFEQVLYLNFTACETDGAQCVGPISPLYRFNARRSYRAY